MGVHAIHYKNSDYRLVTVKWDGAMEMVLENLAVRNLHDSTIITPSFYLTPIL